MTKYYDDWHTVCDVTHLIEPIIIWFDKNKMIWSMWNEFITEFEGRLP